MDDPRQDHEVCGRFFTEKDSKDTKSFSICSICRPAGQGFPVVIGLQTRDDVTTLYRLVVPRRKVGNKYFCGENGRKRTIASIRRYRISPFTQQPCACEAMSVRVGSDHSRQQHPRYAVIAMGTSNYTETVNIINESRGSHTHENEELLRETSSISAVELPNRLESSQG